MANLQTETLTSEQKEYLIEKALSSEAGRQALASSMANPIRLTLDYQAIGRKLVVVRVPFRVVPLVVATTYNGRLGLVYVPAGS